MDRFKSNQAARTVAIGIAMSFLLISALPAIAGGIIEGSGHIQSVDQAARIVVLDGTEFSFGPRTIFYAADGSRTTAKALRNPEGWNGLPGAFLDPMAIKYEAVERAGRPMLSKVEILRSLIE